MEQSTLTSQSATFDIYASASTLKDQLDAIEARSRQSEHIREELRQKLRILQETYHLLEQIEDQEKVVTKELQRELEKAREEVAGVWKFEFNFDAWKGAANVSHRKSRELTIAYLEICYSSPMG